MHVPLPQRQQGTRVARLCAKRETYPVPQGHLGDHLLARPRDSGTLWLFEQAPG